MASPVDGNTESLAWSVVDADTGSETALGAYAPTGEFQIMQTFFDVYAHSHDVWSPDSRAIVLFGSKADTAAVGPSASVWVLDASGRKPPVDIGDGYIGGWSPR